MKFVGASVIILALVLTGGFFLTRDPHLAKGKRLFGRYCSPCHGTGGAGDGYNAKNLDPPARDLTDRGEEYMAKLTNQEIYDVIVQGGAGVDLAPTMPSFGLVFSEEERWSLVAYIRTLHAYKGEKVTFDPAKPYAAKRPRPKPVTAADYLSLVSEKVTDEAVLESIIERGEEAFEEYGCRGCHRIRGAGGELGPDLSRAGFMLQSQFIYRWIRNPQSFKPNTRMPNLNLSDEDALAVTLYLETLKDSPETAGASAGVERSDKEL